MDLVKLEKELNKINETFVGEIRGMTLTQLKDRLSLESLRSQEVSQAKADDQELQDAKDLVREISAPYNSSLKIQKQKIQFIVSQLEEKTIKD
jgi:hypothetical protein